MVKTSYILQDWQANKDTSLKSRLILVMFRLAQSLEKLPSYLRLLSIIYHYFYLLVVDWLLGIDLPETTQIGKNLSIQHGHALVINKETIIGTNCILRNSTTIGHKKLADGSYSASPKIGDNVDIGANVVIIGSITVGNNAVIGAGSVVVKDVPENAVIAGNPARIIRILEINSRPTNHSEDVELASVLNNGIANNF